MSALSRRTFPRLLVAALILLLLSGCGPFLPTLGDEERPLTRADSPDDRLALTFDATWGRDELSKILTTLDGNGVKATFFVGGTFLNLDGEAVRHIAARGHEVGTLGQLTLNLATLPENEITSNLLASQSLLAKILGGPVRYFRPPLGEATPDVVRGASKAGLATVTHSLDSEDHLGLRAPAIAARVVKGARRGDIIRLSASDWSRETNKALPQIVKGLKGRGFKLVLVSELVPTQVQP